MSPLATGAARASTILYSSKKIVTSSTSTDPYFNNVSLLLHMDGANNSTSYIDSSSNNFSMSYSGNTNISTTQSKFGGASGYFYPVYGSVGCSVYTAHNNAFEFGSGDFTLEFFVYYLGFGLGAGYTIYVKGDGIAINGDELEGGRVFTYIKNPSGAYIVNSNTSKIKNIPANTWHHYALCRAGNHFYIFWNGLLQYDVVSSDAVKTTSSTLYIGGLDNSVKGYSNHVGYIDELRITKGVARYTSNFTVPTAAFPNS